MADPVTRTQLENASDDAIALEAFMNGDAATIVERRLAPDIPSLSGLIAALPDTGFIARTTYAALASVTDKAPESLALVPLTDAGTHTDPVVGGTKSNAGVYRWSASPAGWEWLFTTNSLVAALADTQAARDTAIAAAASANAAIQPPNGTVNRWNAIITAAGSSASSTTLAALAVVERRLRLAGLTPKIARLNLRCGNDAAAARTPFIIRPGCGLVSETGTISSWSESTGLTGATLETGMKIADGNISDYNASMGAYVTNQASNTSFMLGNGINWGFSPFYDAGNYTTLAFLFDGGSQLKGMLAVQDGAGGFAGKSTGTMGVVRTPGGISDTYRNGIEITSVGGGGISPTGTSPTSTYQVKTTTWTSCGDWIGDTLTGAEMSAMHWILQEFNLALGRAVSLEGL